MAGQKSQNPTESILSAAKEAKTRETFFSFGDEGLTASVSSYGRLIRITQHFPEEKTGFCVDPHSMPEPYCTVDRMDKFFSLAQRRDPDDHSGGIGPNPDLLCPKAEAAPQHEIINDRWPIFSLSSEDVKLRVGYVASAGTIYQKLQFFYSDGFSEDKKPQENDAFAAMSLRPDLLIRDLDFVDESNEFNEAIGSSESYTTKLSQTHKSITRTHKMEDREIILHIHLLSKDCSVEFLDSNPGCKQSSYSIRRLPGHSGSMLEDSDSGKVLTLVLAYTLEQLKLSKPRISLPTWETFAVADNLLHPRNNGEVKLSEDPILDSILKRNLEYILSVCSIPIPDTIEHGIPAIALTCGDVEGHRVTTAASFYAFQFLLLALDHLMVLHSDQALWSCGTEPRCSSTTSYICRMKTRIERVCQGHIKWVYQTAAASAGISCPNYWTNGQAIEGWETNEWLPKRSLVDAPFQLIKVGDLGKRNLLPSDVFDAAHEAFKTWIDDLKNVGTLESSVFPSQNTPEARIPTQTFYFTDHALIWHAVKSAESMRFEPRVEKKERQEYSADILRKNIIKRFTTEHPVLKKRMIATKRTPTRTRFLLRSKDTFLFRAMEEGLFEGVNLWNDTMDCQKHHEGNDDTKWEDPRRFILSIAMARHNNRINLRSRKEMLQHAISTLLRTASANGLFAGRLDGSLSPVMYDSERMRDDYWAVVFEVPYLLWKFYCSVQINDEIAIDSNLGPESINDRLDSISNSIDNITRLLGDGLVQQAHSEGQQTRSGYWMKRDLPFNNIIAEEKIVELQDEWLFSHPSFFPKNIDDDDVSISDQSQPDTVTQAAADKERVVLCTGFMVDVPDSKSLKKEEVTKDLQLRHFTASTRPTTMMGTSRTTECAKKRFWAFSSQSPDGNAECLKTLHKEEIREQKEINRFFYRHKSYDNFFTEQTEPLLNLWTTEFHMSFTRLVKGSNKFSVQKVAMGFRFEGDFFDRYWTCRYVEAGPQGFSDKDIAQSMIKLLEPKDFTTVARKHEDVTPNTSNREDLRKDSERLKVGPWRQRRVLELLLFRRIMKRMNDCAKDILNRANDTVHFEKKDLQRRLDWPDTSRQLQHIQRELQAKGAEFLENKAKINRWLDREEDRQSERPRWTFNDEGRYGIIISKLLVKNNRSIQDLERYHTMITNLSESITKELERVRSDKEQRRAEEMTLFTYVTAIFLPLGFATGLYSMSGMPDGKTAGAMVGTFFGVLLFVALIFLSITKRGRSIPPSLATEKVRNDNGSTREEYKARAERNSSGQANSTALQRQHFLPGIFCSPKRRPSQRDIESVGSAANAAG